MKHPSKNEKNKARSQYTKRQIDKFVKWSLNQKGYVKYKDLLDLYDYYEIKVY